MEARTGRRYRRGKAWRCREAKVDNRNAWETLDAEVAFGPIDGIMVLEGNGKGRVASTPTKKAMSAPSGKLPGNMMVN